MPRRTAISDCESPSTNRSSSSRRSRSSSDASAGPEQQPVGDAVVGRVVGGRSADVAVLGLVAVRERRRVTAGERSERLQHLLLAAVERRRELCHGRRPAALRGQLGGDASEPRRQVVHRARHVHRPHAVAEVPAQLADHRRRHEGRQRHLALEVVAVDRPHEGERGHLLEVVDRLAVLHVAPRERARERQVALNQRGARRAVAITAPAHQQRAIRGAPGRRRRWHRARSSVAPNRVWTVGASGITRRMRIAMRAEGCS